MLDAAKIFRRNAGRKNLRPHWAGGEHGSARWFPKPSPGRGRWLEEPDEVAIRKCL